jgi:eukaryotic-like serine/threonine-protein kinase
VDHRATTSAVDPVVGRTLDGRYRVEERIARGGMATVYRATDLRLERPVAVKIMHPVFAEDPGFADRFVREARSAARLANPHVVAVHDQGESDGVVYLVMEFVRGRTLRDVIREHGPLTPSQALVLIEPVLEALQAAHAAGIVHRDIKPENVIISDEGRIKVADFGLARVVAGDADGMTMTRGLLIGTVAYLAPEQVESGAADARSDVYAAGVLLFELLTGRAPFTGESPLSVAYQHVNTDVPAASTLSAVPPNVDAVVLKATRRNPDDRHQSAAAFLADVRRCRPTLPAPTPLAQTRRDPADGTHTQVLNISATQALPTQRGRVGKDRRAGRRAVIALTLMATAIVGVGGWQWWDSTRNITIPDVTSLSIEGATTTLELAGLSVDGTQEQFSETIAAGRVVATSPMQGAEVSKGTPIVLIVSQGKERYEVPDLRGLRVAEAQATLERLTLAVGEITEEYDESVPAGQVVGSTPAAADLVRRETSVALRVSRGPAPVDVPDVVGRTLEAARAALEDVGLRAITSEQFSESTPRGSVERQSPSAGTSVTRDSVIELTVSLGPPLVTVPDVRGAKQAQAVAQLEELGFAVRVTYPLGRTPVNRVAIQNPSAGTRIPKGSTITLQVV